jgi:hypothetical protein
MADGVGGEYALPRARAELVEAIFGAFLPLAEVAHEPHLGGVRGPFAEHPRAVVLSVQAVIVVGVGKVGQGVAVGCEFGLAAFGVGVTAFDGFGVGFEPRVIFQELQASALVYSFSLHVLWW